MCVVFCVAVNVSCHVGVRVTSPPFSARLWTASGGINNNNNNNNKNNNDNNNKSFGFK